MLQLRLVATTSAAICISLAGIPSATVASVGSSRTAASFADDRPLNGMLPQPETLTGRLVNMLPVEDPGTAGWQLQKPGRFITLDVTNVRGRVSRFQGQRVRMEGHYVFLGLGRTFVVTRIRRA